MLVAPTSVGGRISDVVDSISTLTGAAARFKKILQGPTEEDLRSHRKIDVYVSPDWHHTCRVALVDDAQPWLDETEVAGIVAFRDMSAIAITIEATAPRSRGGELGVLVGDRRVVVIPDSDADAYWEVVQPLPPDAPDTVGTQALRTRDDRGQWRLDLGAPETPRRRPRFEDVPRERPDA